MTVFIVDEGFELSYRDQLKKLNGNGPYYLYDTFQTEVTLASDEPLSSQQVRNLITKRMREVGQQIRSK